MDVVRELLFLRKNIGIPIFLNELREPPFNRDFYNFVAEKSIHTVERKYEELSWEDIKINVGGRILLAVVSIVCLVCFMLKYYTLGQLKKQLRKKNHQRHQDLLKSTPRRRIYRRYQPKMTKIVSSKVAREVTSGKVPRNSRPKP